MEPLLETIDLDVEEAQELLFKVKVEGIDPAPAQVRLVCETGDVAYMFSGRPAGDDNVQFLLPVLKDKLREGTYLSRVEVLIENRYFAPITFNIRFKKAVKVVAEAVSVPQRKAIPQVKVTAQPVVVAKPAVAPAPKQPAAAPSPAAPTLRERLEQRRSQQAKQPVEELGAAADLVKQVARSFVRSREGRK